MSRQDQFKTKTNPAEVSIEWGGAKDDGHFRYYDKETKQNVEIPSIRFAVLGERSCVRGWLEDKKSNAYSNEVASTKNQILTVKYFADGKPRELCSGKYDEIKDQLAAQGIKYNKVVYIIVLSGCDQIQEGTIAKMFLKGAAFSAWIDFKDKKDAVIVSGSKEGKKGAVRYMMPVFERGDLDEMEIEEAELAYEQVNSYFSTAPHTTEHSDAVPHEVIDAQEDLVPADDSEIPF